MFSEPRKVAGPGVFRPKLASSFLDEASSAAEIVVAGRHGTKVLLSMRRLSALTATYFSNSVALLTTAQAVKQTQPIPWH